MIFRPLRASSSIFRSLVKVPRTTVCIDDISSFSFDEGVLGGSQTLQALPFATLMTQETVVTYALTASV